LDTDVDDRPALCHADVLVSGLSSRIFNFMLLDKPAVLFRDSLDTSEPLGRRRLELMRSVYPVADGTPRLVELVQRALRDPGQGSDRRRIQADAIFANPGRATDAVVRVIYDALGVARLLREG
jgi:CDP-glycerol glycerophosphotransferase (TagB/SpsB family)